MDHARCLCQYNFPHRIIDPRCPKHGQNGKDPIVPYRLSQNDRLFLRRLRIATEGI